MARAVAAVARAVAAVARAVAAVARAAAAVATVVMVAAETRGTGVDAVKVEAKTRQDGRMATPTCLPVRGFATPLEAASDRALHHYELLRAQPRIRRE